MMVPVVLFEVCLGTDAEDPKAAVLVSLRTKAAAEDINRAIDRARLAGVLHTAGQSFPRAVDREVDLETVEAAEAAGYQVRGIVVSDADRAMIADKILATKTGTAPAVAVPSAEALVP